MPRRVSIFCLFFPKHQSSPAEGDHPSLEVTVGINGAWSEALRAAAPF
jgi:hypothetical protein